MTTPLKTPRTAGMEVSRAERMSLFRLVVVVVQALGSAGPPVPAGAPGVTGAAEGSAAEHYLTQVARDLLDPAATPLIASRQLRVREEPAGAIARSSA
jgi:hypothetical protein